MNLENLIARSGELVNSIAKELWDLSIPSTVRCRVAAACFAVAQEHHNAIVVLFDSKLNSSAFALIRAEYEAYIRGLWLVHCATDGEVENFSTGAEPPSSVKMLAAIEGIPTFDEKQLSEIKSKHWSAMCSYTHTGSLQVQRWNTEDAIEPNFSEDEIQVVLRFSGIFSLLAAVGIASLAQNEEIANRLLTEMRAFVA